MHQWAVKNTFIDLDEPTDGVGLEYSDDYGLRRSKSDSSLSKTSGSSSQRIPSESRPESPACTQPLLQDSRQVLFASSSSSSSQPMPDENLPPARLSPACMQSPPKDSRQFENHLQEGFTSSSFQEVFLSSSEASSEDKLQHDATKPRTSSEGKTQNDGFQEGGVIDATTSIMCFPIDEAMKVVQKITELVEKGTDLRQVLSTDMGGVDISLYVPVNPTTGQRTSLGSVHHLVGSCTPCMFLSKGRCRKGQNCLHCHFEHAPEKQKARGWFFRRRQRLQMQESKEMLENQQIAVPDGQDGQAIVDGQTSRDQPLPVGTRISL